jgi:hypothetical protein
LPDGKWLTYYSRGEIHEDIFVIKADGAWQSQLTDDSFRDRLPRWSPGGVLQCQPLTRGTVQGAPDMFSRNCRIGSKT